MQTTAQRSAASNQAAIERQAGIQTATAPVAQTQKQVSAAENQAAIERAAGLQTVTSADNQATAAKNSGLQPAPTVITSEAANNRNTQNQQALAAMTDQNAAAVDAAKKADMAANGINDVTRTPLTPASSGTTGSTTASNTTGTTGTTETGSTTNASRTGATETSNPDPLKAQIDAATTAIDAEYKQANDLLTARMANLDSSTQAQIQNIQRIYAARRDETNRLNQVLLQSNTKAGIRAGRDRYAPEINQGILTDVEQQGLARLTALDNEEQQLIAEAQQANASNQFDLLSKQMDLLTSKRKEKDQAVKDLNDEAMKQEQFALEKAKSLRELAQFDREDASASVDAMVASGMDPESVDPSYFAKLDASAGFVPGTSKGMMEVAAMERQATTEAQHIQTMNAVVDLTSKLAPDQFVDFNGNRYYGSKSDNEYVGYEIEKSTGNITSIYRNDATGEMTFNTQKGVLAPNVEYEQQWVENADGSKSLWYVPNDPTMSAIPAVGGAAGASGGANGVNVSAMQEKYPAGMKGDPNNPNDFWCLGFWRDKDVRGQDLMNEVGNTIEEKRASVEQDIGFGPGQRPPQAGDYMISAEDSTYGHFMQINEIRTDPKTGKRVAVVTESNGPRFNNGQSGGPLTVAYTRTIPLDVSNTEANGGIIIGFKHSEMKPEFTSQPQSGMSGGQLTSTPPAETASIPQQAALRKEIASDTAIAQYNDLSSTYTAMGQLASQALDKGDKGSVASLDQALVTMFNKMLDPTSVVREGEYARTAEGQSLIARAEGLKTKFGQGGAGISNDTRRDMVNVAKTLLDVAEGRYQESIDFYLPILEEYGLEPSQYIKGYSPVSGSTSTTTQVTQSSETAPPIAPEKKSWLDQLFGF